MASPLAGACDLGEVLEDVVAVPEDLAAVFLREVVFIPREGRVVAALGKADSRASIMVGRG